MSDDIETVGLGFRFEDLPLGRRFRTLGRTVTEADLVGFIGVTGMTEVLFTNVEHVHKEAGYAGRLVPGALVFSFAEGLLMQATFQTTGLAFLSMEFEVRAPTFVGDTIHVESEVIEARASETRPERGLVRTRNRVIKQDGTPVLEYRPLRMIKRRPQA
ncbi:MaoC family dehydratase [Solimonas soli]|jgi:acyl dehydratase|uniref:MaoC family dehydratase n=1 Tax=Solimonas soli TaxID=413479 RepID=UPI000489FF29|nr:MaoC/PaaZ C-terminal domain-containing protein [Solimonas soli]